MKHLKKGIAIVLFYVIAGALLVYAASRSLDFITQTLPPDQQAIGLLALAATSGGAVAWLMVFLYAAQGTGQKVTSALMVGVDLVGEFALFTVDTLLSSGNAGMTAALPAEDVQMVIIGLSALIAVNIAATFAYHLTEPENAKNMRESAVREDLENKALALIEKRGEELAAELAPKLADQWVREFEARFGDYRALGLGHEPAKPINAAAAGWPGLPQPETSKDAKTVLPGKLTPVTEGAPDEDGSIFHAAATNE